MRPKRSTLLTVIGTAFIPVGIAVSNGHGEAFGLAAKLWGSIFLGLAICILLAAVLVGVKERRGDA
jgi:putative effector of murein hydrolase LrgA (UPF0299 family)